MSYVLTAGAWPELKKFLDSVPGRSKVMWVTYSLTIGEGGQARVALDYLCSRHFSVRVLCAHPGRGRPALRRGSLEAILECRNNGHSIELRGFPAEEGPELEDSDDPSDKTLHAKIVLVSTNDKRQLAVHGSFNFADGSLGSNIEQVSVPAAADKSMLSALEELWRCAGPVKIEHCIDERGPIHARSSVAPLVDSPATMKRAGNAQRYRDKKRQVIDVPIDAPEVVDRAVTALDKMLKTYPDPDSQLCGFQYEQFLRLNSEIDTRKRNLLYLPVGTGKSFIAFRWLLQRIAEDERASPRAVFLVPNKWMQETIRADLALVAEQANVPFEKLQDYVRVVRPAEERSVRKLAVAGIVADECHNWAPEGPKAQSKTATSQFHVSYTKAFNLIEKYAEGAPVIGMSATPCRMEEQKFSVQAFVRRFVVDKRASLQKFWGMSLQCAIGAGLLVPPIFKPIADWAEPQISAILHDERGVPVQMGDYDETVLRDVWGVLDERRERLVKEIVGTIRSEERSRVVVYLPPVGEAGDLFVESLRRKLDSTFGTFGFWDARTRGEDNRSSVLEEFREAEASRKNPAILIGIDRFCEGVSIKSIDMLVMLRATLSPRVAVQALGRGLRLHPGKNNCLVLDPVQSKQRLLEWDSLGEIDEAGSVRRTSAAAATARSPRRATDNRQELSRLLKRLPVSELRRVLREADCEYDASERKVDLQGLLMSLDFAPCRTGLGHEKSC